jgi:hypothetical protein
MRTTADVRAARSLLLEASIALASGLVVRTDITYNAHLDRIQRSRAEGRNTSHLDSLTSLLKDQLERNYAWLRFLHRLGP